MNQTDFVVVLSTAGNHDEAQKIAERIVGERMVACVNIIPSIVSVYRWKDQIAKDNEVLLVIKTHRSRITDLQRMIRELHSYEIPEFIVLPIVEGLPEYLSWINESTGGWYRDGESERR